MGSNQLFTLKDVTAANKLNLPGSVGLVDNIINVAPEIEKIPGRVIPGLSYEATILTAVGDNMAFRALNSGVTLSAPSLDVKRFNTFALDCQFAVDEGEIIREEAQGQAMSQTLSIHASAGVRQKALKLGRQVYQGSMNDPMGFPGLIDMLYTQRTQVDSRTGLKINQAIDAGGTAAGACEIVWFVKTGPQGIHFIFGNGTGILMGPWMRLPGQPAPNWTQGNPLVSTQWKNNMFGYIGLSMAQIHAVGALVNINSVQNGTTNGIPTYPNPFTDGLATRLYGLWPIGAKPDLCFATQNAIVSLQMSRSVTNMVINGENSKTGRIAPIADFPTHLPTCGNIPIIPTDSIMPGNQIFLN